jgi:hypothetical protein
MPHDKPIGSVRLHFDPEHDDSGGSDLLAGQLSSVTSRENDLWLASDEVNTLERLTPLERDTFGRHRPFPLADVLELPGEPDDEIDVEGLDCDSGYLWLVGSHGLKRRNADASKKAAKQIAKLAEVRSDGNRCLLARIPLAAGDDGGSALHRRVDGRSAARLMGGRDGNVLTDALRTDPHLAPFLVIPGKDNGLDVEGITVRGNRVMLGLRGPVLRGWAVVLELRVEDASDGMLSLAPMDRDGRLYRKHFLDLRGLGIRELCADGDDVLVLAGPSMDLDGPAGVFRWRDSRKHDEETITGRDDLPQVVELPYGTGQDGECDHPEGMTPWQIDGDRTTALLVVYDSPHRKRMEGEGAVRADVFAVEH